MTYPPLHDGGLQIFDVDHGQCALLTMPAVGRTAYRVLIDCGHATNFMGGPWYPGAHLQGLGVDYVDMLVCTNFDEDHMSGYPDLVRRGISIGCILADTQETTTYYGSKAIGITNYCGQPGVRRVLTTRSHGEIRFSFLNGRCDAW